MKMIRTLLLAASPLALVGCTLLMDTELPAPLDVTVQRPLGAACTTGDQCSTGSCINQYCVDEGHVFLPAGSFIMGQTAATDPHVDPGGEEEPTHEVTLTRGFAMGTTEVTGETWFSVPSVGCIPNDMDLCWASCDTDPTNPRTRGNCCPVANVNWYDAVFFANLLSEQQGLEPCYELQECEGTFIGHASATSSLRCNLADVVRLTCERVLWNGDSDCGYRLPTEAEWEYAVRERGQLTGSIYYKNQDFSIDPTTQRSDALDEIAVYRGNSNLDLINGSGVGLNCTAWPEMSGIIEEDQRCSFLYAGSRRANGLGIYDLLGNVEEWVWDTGLRYTSAPKTDPRRDGAGPDSTRVVRGGAFSDQAVECRMTARDNQRASLPASQRGFRLVRAEPPAAR